jgi:hypothetical protein
MAPSELGVLPDDEQLGFIMGHRPYLMTNFQYDKVELRLTEISILINQIKD